MNWKYKIELENQKVFNEIEQTRNIKIPKSLVDFIIKANGATPEKKLITIAGEERVLSAVLSFNEDDEDSYFQFSNCVMDNKMIPFAIDPFGNLFMVGCDDEEVYYWKHEENDIDKSGFCISALEDVLS